MFVLKSHVVGCLFVVGTLQTFAERLPSGAENGNINYEQTHK